MEHTILALKLIGTLLAIGGLGLAALRTWAALVPIFDEYQRQKLLNREISHGPYDPDTIQRSTRYYIRPSFTNVDPSSEAEYRNVHTVAREPLFPRMEKWLKDPGDRKHLLLLAESGIGKTSFLLNYFAYNSTLPKRRRQQISLVALGRPDADKQIDRIDRKAGRVAFLDALDEDVKAREDHRTRIGELMEKCQDFRAVVITCRTQFFLSDEEIPRDVGLVKIRPRVAGEEGTYQFWKLYLAPFDDNDIRAYLKRRYPLWARASRRKAQNLVKLIPRLSMRPMLLANIPEVVESEDPPKTAWELYNIMVQAWLQRENRWVQPNDLLRFSQFIAADLYSNRDERGMEAISAAELEQKAIEASLPHLKQWQLTGRSLLNRDVEGNYKFSHRSIMEFLFLQHWIATGDIPTNLPLTDQMRSFIIDQAPAPLVFEAISIDALIFNAIDENSPLSRGKSSFYPSSIAKEPTYTERLEMIVNNRLTFKKGRMDWTTPMHPAPETLLSHPNQITLVPIDLVRLPPHLTYDKGIYFLDYIRRSLRKVGAYDEDLNKFFRYYWTLASSEHLDSSKICVLRMSSAVAENLAKAIVLVMSHRYLRSRSDPADPGGRS